MNEIYTTVTTGTIGELLVTLRLLQYGVQAAPPIKDSGNDLIAVLGDSFRAIQIKTSTTGEFGNLGTLDNKRFHILALVHLVSEENNFKLDESSIFLLHKKEVLKTIYYAKNLAEHVLSGDLVNQLFGVKRGEVELEIYDDDNDFVIYNGDNHFDDGERKAVLERF